MNGSITTRPNALKMDSPPKRRASMSAQQKRNAIAAYLMIAPTLVNFLIFSLGALLAGLALGFFEYSFFSPPRFVGLTNFQNVFTDPRVWITFKNTIWYVIGMVLLDLVWALGLALALNSFMPNILKIVFRTVFFFPVLTSGAVIAIVWRYLFNTDMGIVNWFLVELGMQRIPWLISPRYSIPAVILSTVWNGVGFNMVLFIAALKNVPQELYEAAQMDGAGRSASFWNLTLPLISPTIFFVIVKGLIGVFQLFDSPYMLTSGGPGDSSRSLVMYIYEVGFQKFELGYASSIALLLFVCVLGVTVLQFVLQKRWVFYR
jgi:multiple sugar transport system permease protein